MGDRFIHLIQFYPWPSLNNVAGLIENSPLHAIPTEQSGGQFSFQVDFKVIV